MRKKKITQQLFNFWLETLSLIIKINCLRPKHMSLTGKNPLKN